MPRGEKTRALHADGVKRKAESFLKLYPKVRVVKKALKGSGLLLRTLKTQMKLDTEFRLKVEAIQEEISKTIFCRTCSTAKPPASFHADRRDGRKFAICRECVSVKQKKNCNALAGRCSRMAIGAKSRDPLSDLTPKYLQDMWVAQSGVCYYTGTPMSLVSGVGEKNWNVVSVDKKDPSLGYRKGNVALCSALANVSKSFRTEEEFVNFCGQVVAHRKKR